MELVFNLWDADYLGDGTTSGKVLTAYLAYDDEGIDTSKFTSVNVSDVDYRAMADNPDTDDEWHYAGSPKHRDLMELFITYQVMEAKN